MYRYVAQKSCYFSFIANWVSISAIGNWFLTRHIVISQSIAKQQAFTRFVHDVGDYIEVYGSYEKARLTEHFADFIHRNLGEIPSALDTSFESSSNSTDQKAVNAESRIPKSQLPPSGFTLLSPEGVILQTPNEQEEGKTAPNNWLRKAQSISINGEVAVLACSRRQQLL